MAVSDEAATADENGRLDRGALLFSSPALLDCGQRAVVLGHRTSAPAPFRDLDKVQVGATVSLVSGERRCEWRVASVEVLPVEAVYERIGAWDHAGELLIVTCAHADGTPGGITHRVVVTASSISV
jgi:LPXTG-site transpeptidase (sortase) family protein